MQVLTEIKKNPTISILDVDWTVFFKAGIVIRYTFLSLALCISKLAGVVTT